MGRQYSPMVQSPDGRGVLTSGGTTNGANWGEANLDDKLYELRAGANSWKILNITMKKARTEHAFIPLQ